MRYFIPVALMAWTPAWARFEDLWGEPEYVERFSTDTQALIYAALVMAGWAFYLHIERSRWSLACVGALLAAPVWYVLEPSVLGAYIWWPVLWYIVLKPIWTKFSQG